MDLYVFTFHQDRMIYRALSPLTPEEVDKYGLPTEAVLGQISALLPSMTPDQFEENSAFVELLHGVVRERGAGLEELQAEAKARGTGQVALIDGRAGQVTGEIAAEDIIGRFEVRRGEILPGSYTPGEAYRLLTDNGPVQLPGWLEEALLARVRARLMANPSGREDVAEGKAAEQ